MKLILPNFSKFKQRITDDFKKKEFLPIKILFFLIFGANVSLIPFLTLQARSLGITEEEVGIIYSFIPIASLIAPALSGMLADKIGNFRILLSVLTAMAGLSSILFLTVPPGRITHTLPEKLPLEIACSSFYGSTLRVAKPYECEPAENFDSFPVVVLKCSVTCLKQENSTDEVFRKFEDSNLNCTESSNCILKSSIEYSLMKENSSDSSIEIFHSEDGNISESTTLNKNVSIHFSRGNGTLDDITYNSDELICPALEKNIRLEPNCFTTCQAETVREQMCSNKVYIEELNPSFTFYSHLLIRLFKEFTLATSLPLLEGAAVTILKEHNGDFGFQRLYCNIGMMVMTPISGTLIDIYTRQNGFEDYRPAMYMYCGLKLIAAFIILFLNLEFKKASTKVITDFSTLMLNPEIVFFLLATFLAGTSYGYIETFLFWLLEDLGADKQLMGLTLTVGSVFGIPLLMMSTPIIRKIGHVNVIVIGFLVYIIRLIGYTLINSPWWAMPFEALESFTVSLMVVSFMSYAAVLATPGTIVTLQGMYGGLYNGVGRGAGSLIGGFLIEHIGIFQTFRVIAGISAASGFFYWIINVCFFRRNQSATIDIENEGKGNCVLEKIENPKPEKENTELTKEKENNKREETGIRITNNTKLSNMEGSENKAFEGDNLE